MTNTQFFENPCAVEPCPDCGRKPEDSNVAASAIVHSDSCPLWTSIQIRRQHDGFWFRRNRWIHTRVRPFLIGEIAEQSWYGHLIPEGAEVLVSCIDGLVSRAAALHGKIVAEICDPGQEQHSWIGTSREVR